MWGAGFPSVDDRVEGGVLFVLREFGFIGGSLGFLAEGGRRVWGDEGVWLEKRVASQGGL